MTKFNNIMIYLKSNKKINKYIKDNNERKYRELEANILKNIISSNVLKNVKNYKKT